VCLNHTLRRLFRVAAFHSHAGVLSDFQPSSIHSRFIRRNDSIVDLGVKYGLMWRCEMCYYHCRIHVQSDPTGVLVSIKNRRSARVIALQVLYELDATQHTPDTVLTARLEESPLEADLHDFAHVLVEGVLRHRRQLDAVLQQAAPEFPLDQVAIVDRNVLRIALYEWIVGKHSPVKVAINEAVELAKEYGSESSSRFVNGVLGALVTRESEVQAAFEPGQD
jgi:N utilization substance protein B